MTGSDAANLGFQWTRARGSIRQGWAQEAAQNRLQTDLHPNPDFNTPDQHPHPDPVTAQSPDQNANPKMTQRSGNPGPDSWEALVLATQARIGRNPAGFTADGSVEDSTWRLKAAARISNHTGDPKKGFAGNDGWRLRRGHTGRSWLNAGPLLERGRRDADASERLEGPNGLQALESAAEGLERHQDPKAAVAAWLDSLPDEV